MAEQTLVRRELILGGQRSGKSSRAEWLAAQWLAQAPGHRAVLVATAVAGDDEMRQRIARHRQDRALRLPTLLTVQEPLALASCIMRHADEHTMVLVDCLTLWLTNLTMPLDAPGSGAVAPTTGAMVPAGPVAALEECLSRVAGPVVLVSNEIGLGVVPMGAASRRFVDDLGRLNQGLARLCDRVSFMVAGLALPVKGPA